MLNGAQGCRMVSPDSTKYHKGKWNEVYYSQILEEELEEKVKARKSAGTKKGRMWGICLYYGPKMEYFEVPWLRPDLLIQTKKCRIFVCFPWVFFCFFLFFFLRGHKEKALPGRQGRLFITKTFGVSCQKVTFTYGSWAVI